VPGHHGLPAQSPGSEGAGVYSEGRPCTGMLARCAVSKDPAPLSPSAIIPGATDRRVNPPTWGSPYMLDATPLGLRTSATTRSDAQLRERIGSPITPVARTACGDAGFRLGGVRSMGGAPLWRPGDWGLRHLPGPPTVGDEDLAQAGYEDEERSPQLRSRASARHGASFVGWDSDPVV
jgi:hypothetical protein